MKLYKENILNNGMSQDYSISKEAKQEFAYENRNIRIQSLGDNSLLTITNIKGPKEISSVEIKGTIVGKCLTKDYIILFTTAQEHQNIPNNTCRIYRLDCKKGTDNLKCNLLYEGTDLFFERGRTIDTLFYYENKNIQKVYWVESWYSDEELKQKITISGRNIRNNPPRVINIITPNERNGGECIPYTENVFDFYPQIGSIPNIEILKEYNTISELPAGTIQYFISYYFENGAETLIANNSSSFTIDFQNRGAQADESGMCSFNIKISNVNTKFDYFRIYSAIRTTKEGPLLVKIVDDVKIVKSDPKAYYTIVDTGIDQETLDPSLLFYIGGTPLYANTLEQKDNTLFLGNIKTSLIDVPNNIVKEFDRHKLYIYVTEQGIVIPIKINARDNYYTNYITYSTIYNYYKELTFIKESPVELPYYNKKNPELFDDKNCILDKDWLKSKGIEVKNPLHLNKVIAEDILFTLAPSNTELTSNKDGIYKGVQLSPNQFSSYYNYKLQTKNSEVNYKTFKAGEVYRFGIQFLNKNGLWTSVLWIGDKECNSYPIIDNENHYIYLNNAVYNIPTQVTNMCKNAGFINYRIVIANPEKSNGRRVLAQGVVCPTLFSPGQRALGLHSISSWVMRPRGGDCSYHHFEPITSTFAAKGAEIYGYDTGFILGTNRHPSSDFNEDGKWFSLDKFTCGGLYYSTPYYGVEVDEKWKNVPRYLITQMSVHSGHLIVMKVTEIASNYIETNFYNSSTDAYDYKEIKTLEFDINESNWVDAFDILNKSFEEQGWDTRDLLSVNTLKKLGQRLFWGEFLTLFTLITEATALVGAILGITVASGGGFFGVAAGIWIASLSGGTGAIAGSVAGPLCAAFDNYVGKLKKDWQKELHGKGYIQIDTNESNELKDTDGLKIFSNDGNGLPIKFASKGLNVGLEEYDEKVWDGNGLNAVHFIKIKPLLGKSHISKEIESEWNKFYIDESIVTFHSPDLENCRNKNLKFRIVGAAPINSSYSDLQILTSTAPFIKGGVDIQELTKFRNVNINDSNVTNIGLYSDFIYWDGSLREAVDEEGNLKGTSYEAASLDLWYFSTDPAKYKVYLWDKNIGSSITGGTKEVKELKQDGNTIGTVPSMLKEKTILNLLNSFGTIYFNDTVKYDSPSNIKLFDPVNDRIYITGNENNFMYAGNYDHLITMEKACNFSIQSRVPEGGYPDLDDPEGDIETADPDKSTKIVSVPFSKLMVRIKYNSTPHAVIDLHNSYVKGYKKLLPVFSDEIVYKRCGNRKDHKTHEWVYAETYDGWKYIDSCWTKEEDWYHSNVYFNAIYSILPLPSDTTNLEKHPVLTATDLNTKLSLYDRYNIATSIKQKRGAHIGNIRIYYEHSYTDAELKLVVNEYILLKELKELKDCTIEGHKVTIPIKDANGDEIVQIQLYIYYDLYKINQVKFEDNNNLFSEVTASSIVNNAKDEVYILRDDFSHGRFLWSCSDDIKNCFKIYKDFPIHYEQPIITDNYGISKYLFVGELYQDIPEYQLYGGYSESNLSQLQWYPVSKITPLNNSIKKMTGDTYYQRWDCLKTYPTTEEDANKVVDIVSLMVESRINLDARTDLNRDLYNIMSRPTNFNKFNSVYDSKSNIFSYTTKLSDYNTTEYPNQLVWSMTKNFLGKVDSWTNVNVMSSTNCSSPVTKLKNHQNTLLSFNESSIDIVNFNNKNFIQSDTEFIEVANSAKVDGTAKLYNVYGTTNNTTLVTEQGLYFIDDSEKSIIRLSKDGSITKLGIGKMNTWLKNNIIKGSYTVSNNLAMHLEYDPIYKDIYIMNDSTCLVYNELLDTFTSFMDYPNCYMLYYTGLDFIAITNKDTTEIVYPDPENPTYQQKIIVSKVNLYNMFNGDYNTTFDNLPVGYSVHYRINPSPYNDKVFTNAEFIADCLNEDTLQLIPGKQPFDTIHVWNEYQDTKELPLEYKRNSVSNLKQKYRIWKADIPRAGKKLGGERIRNPWIHFKLEKKKENVDNYKLNLHSLNILYMM